MKTAKLPSLGLAHQQKGHGITRQLLAEKAAAAIKGLPAWHGPKKQQLSFSSHPKLACNKAGSISPIPLIKKRGCWEYSLVVFMKYQTKLGTAKEIKNFFAQRFGIIRWAPKMCSGE